MNQELAFEAMPFAVDPEFEGNSEGEEEWGRRRSFAGGGAGRYPRSRSQAGLPPSGAKRPSTPRPRPTPARPRGSWVVVREPYGLVSEPYPNQPEPSGSERVRWVQDSLNRILGLRVPVTGVMGPETRSAVRSFQKQKGLPVSGILGPDTEKALLDARYPTDAAAPPAEPAQDQGGIYEFETLDLESPSSMPTLRRGSRGSAVADLQRRLAAAGFSPGVADGIFGSLTDAAVKSFQRSRGLTADGIVGPVTWGQLESRSGWGTPGPAPRPTPTPSPMPAPARGAAGARIVAEAQKHIGFSEGPNNENPFSAYFGVPNVAWCAYFVSYVYTMAGVPLNIGSSDVLLDTLIDQDKFSTSTPAPGDIVVFDWSRSDHDPAEHVGIVEGVYRNSSGQLRVKTIEGNSSNGVNRREYAFGDSKIVGYGHLAS